MYQRIDFSKFGGYPLTQNDMAFLQNSYNKVFEAVTRTIGTYIIMSGVTQTSPNVYSAGWIVYNGEIVPFAGGTNLGEVIVNETSQTKTFKDTNINAVIFSREAGFVNSGGVPFSSFLRISLATLNTRIDSVEYTANNALTIANQALSSAGSAGSPVGLIAMWSGAINNIPTGWMLCDGVDNRPNLKGRFIVGYNQSVSDYNAIGKIGGLETVTLNELQLPSHTHTMNNAGSHFHTISRQSGNDAGSGKVAVGDQGSEGINPYTDYAGDHYHTNGSTGQNQPHENRPPYFVLAYIIKV